VYCSFERENIHANTQDTDTEDKNQYKAYMYTKKDGIKYKHIQFHTNCPL